MRDVAEDDSVDSGKRDTMTRVDTRENVMARRRTVSKYQSSAKYQIWVTMLITGRAGTSKLADGESLASTG